MIESYWRDDEFPACGELIEATAAVEGQVGVVLLPTKVKKWAMNVTQTEGTRNLERR